MSVEDKLTNVAVRRILSALWVDITRVGVRCTGGVVYLTGELIRMTASHPDLSEVTLRDMDLQIRRLSGVRDVRYQLKNWERKLAGQWAPRRLD
jgi:hypothetical protein